MKRLLLLTILHLVIFIGISAQPTCNVRTFGIRDGLPTGYVTSIKQGSDGLIWIATWNGLCCYDGNQFSVFQGEPWGSDDALSTYRISAIEPDSQGNVWVRTYDSGLYLYDTHQCRFINVGLLVERQYGKPIKPRNFYAMPSGYMWITDEHGAMNLRVDDRYPTDTAHITVVDMAAYPQLGRHLHKVEADRQGNEWLVGDNGMLRLDGKEWRKGVFTHRPQEQFTDSRGRQWPADKNVLWVEDRFGTLWQLTRDGKLSYYDEQRQQLRFHQQLPAIDKWTIDQQHNVWFSSNRGLSLLNFQYQYLRQLPVQHDEQTRSLLSRRDGTVWAGTYDGYIAVYTADRMLSGWITPQGRLSVAPVKFADRIYTMLEDSHGHVWIGTKGQGLYRLAANGSAVSHFMPDKGDAYSISHPDIYDLDEDEQGNLWIATFGRGVNVVKSEALKVKSGGLRFIHKGNELKRYPAEGFDKVRRITHDRHGNMIASTTWGLMTFSNKAVGDTPFYTTNHEQSDTTSLRTNDVMQTLVTSNGHIYTVTLGGSIQLLTSVELLQDNLHFRQVAAMDQGRGYAQSMIEDPSGQLWIVRETDVNRYNPKDGRLEQFGPNSMSNSIRLTEAMPTVDRQGQLWFGMVGGLLTFNPKELKKSQYLPRIIFNSVRYQGEQHTHPILHQQRLEITNSDRRSMTISFAALDYEDNYLMQYAYRLDDNSKWNYIGHNPHIAFSELSPGEHTLTVKSTNCDGIWTDNETQLTIDIQPLLWERSWFQLLLLLVVIMLAATAIIRYQRHRQQVKEREQRMEHILRQYNELQEQLERQAESAGTSTAEPTVTREYKLEEPQVDNPDDKMMDQLMKFIEAHISDEGLKIEDMADAVGLGRTVFYGKVKELVGVSPSDFLRQVRMQRAIQLVVKSKMTFSEIAYSVGFTDPKYFTKCFKKQTGMTPSEYRTSQLSSYVSKAS